MSCWGPKIGSDCTTIKPGIRSRSQRDGWLINGWITGWNSGRWPGRSLRSSALSTSSWLRQRLWSSRIDSTDSSTFETTTTPTRRAPPPSDLSTWQPTRQLPLLLEECTSAVPSWRMKRPTLLAWISGADRKSPCSGQRTWTNGRTVSPCNCPGGAYTTPRSAKPIAATSWPSRSGSRRKWLVFHLPSFSLNRRICSLGNCCPKSACTRRRSTRLARLSAILTATFT